MAQVFSGSQVPNLVIANRTFTNLSGLIILYAQFTTGGSGATFRLATGSSGYAVTAAKTLRVYGFKILTRSAATGNIYLAQTDNDVGYDSGTAFTNPVGLGNTVNTFFSPTATVNSTFEVAIDLRVTTGKYLSIRDSAGTANIMAIAYCYET